MPTGDATATKLQIQTRRYTVADGLVFAGLAGLVALSFWEVVAHGRVFFFRDFALFFYPKRAVVAEAMRHFRIPFWDSVSACGEPVLGTYQTAVFYPPAIIYYLLPMPQSFMWFVVSHFLISGAGAYFMMRAWGARRIAAGFTAVAWAFSPAFVSTVDYVSFHTALSWLPWCLGFTRRIAVGASFRAFLGLAVTFAMAVLAAAPEPVIFTGAIVVGYAVWSAGAALLRRGPAKALRPLALTALALALAVVLSGVEVAPFLNTLRYSARQQPLIMEDAGMWSATPSDAVLTLLPRFYLFADRGGIYWRSQHWLKTVYLGALIPFLAAWTLLAVRRNSGLLAKALCTAIGAAAAFGLAVFFRRYAGTDVAPIGPVFSLHYAAASVGGGLVGFAAAATRRRNVFFLAVSIPFSLLALGSNSTVWTFFYNHFPAMGLIRFPVKFYLPAAFALAVMAGFGVDDCMVLARRKRLGKIIVLLAAVVVAAAVFGYCYWAMQNRAEQVFKAITPKEIVARGEAGSEEAAERYEALQWSFRRSAEFLALGAAAILLAVLLTRAKTRRVYGSLAVAFAIFADTSLFGAHLNPVAGPEIYTEPPTHMQLGYVPRGEATTRVFMTPALQDNLRKHRLARIHDLVGLRNFIEFVKGIRFSSPEELFKWLGRTSAPPFKTLEELDQWLKTTNTAQFISDIEYEPAKETFYPNTNMPYGVPTVDGFEPLAVRWHHDIYQRMRTFDVPPHRQKFLPRLWAAGAVVDYQEGPPGFAFLPMETPGERAFLADHVLAVETDAQAEATVVDTEIDVTKRIVLVAADAAAAGAFLGAAAGEAPAEGEPSAGSVKLLFDTGNACSWEVTAGRRALLYVADNFFPNFKAAVDGAPAPIWRANYGYRAVPVEPGRHTVTFTFVPWDFYAGLAMTALAVAALFIMRRAWPKREPAPAA